MKDLQELISFALELTDLSREIILSHSTNNITHEIKEDGSPVTPVDREVERKLRERIDARYPQYGILGEEYPGRNMGAERVWLIDPIDGTKYYTAGIPLYGTLVALAEEGRFILGVMDFPATHDRWVGGRGYPARWNGKRISVRRCSVLAQAFIAPCDPKRGRVEEQRGSSRLADAALYTVWGTGCYSFAMVASGKLDIAMDNDLDIFDFAAPAAVIEAAGGSVTDWHGAPLTLESEDCALFLGDPTLLQPVIDLLHE